MGDLAETPQIQELPQMAQMAQTEQAPLQLPSPVLEMPAEAATLEAPVVAVEAPQRLEDLVIPVYSAGPPKWKRPLADASKITQTEGPPGVAELFESMVAVGSSDVETGDTSPILVKRPRAAAKEAAEGVERKKRAAPGAIALSAELSEDVKPLAERIIDSMTADTVKISPPGFIPSDRKAFGQFIIQTFRSSYQLPKPSSIPNPNACADLEKASATEQRMFQYQEFVRDYIQRSSPYRGILVYHGLGAGKTCTSIAAMEALYNSGQKPVYVFTPASLSTSYKEEIMKCGPFIFRTKNHWTFVPIPSLKKPTDASEMLLKVLGVPIKSVMKMKGGWLPDPARAPNFDALKPDEKKQIQEQILAHIDSKLEFIHYNGVLPDKVKQWACAKKRNASASSTEESKQDDEDIWLRKFDGATVVIDEVHNMVRSINNSELERMYEDEPRSMAQFNPKHCNSGIKYPKSYLLYRLLANAVGCKIIALSATPIINFPQELGILANMLAGDRRMVEFKIPVLAVPNEFKDSLNAHPEIDFVEIVPNTGNRTSTVRLTPIPSGFRKLLDKQKQFRGFTRDLGMEASNPEIVRERHLGTWFAKIAPMFDAAKLGISGLTYSSVTRLPDTEKPFREMFIDTEKVQVKEALIPSLSARLAGLISFYKGAKADLMATVTEDTVVRVQMSDHQLNVYSEQRKSELDKELKDKKKKTQSAYQMATSSQSNTFKIFSRAVCNFAFPSDIERPIPRDYADMLKMIDEKAGPPREEITAERAVEIDDAEEARVAEEEAVAAREEDEVGVAPEETEVSAAVSSSAPEAKEAEATTYEAALEQVLRKLKARRNEFFTDKTLPRYSPKFQAALDRIAISPGPVLVYSNFKKLEGVGLFGVCLETQQKYVRLDIVQNAAGAWVLSPETLAGTTDSKRYISYTGDDANKKRKILLAIFNGRWDRVPGDLATQIKAVAKSDTNLHGEICKTLIITQTGAEGLNLVNVRQVHLMEPFWNYVRLEQVKGRAVRICSHSRLPPAERNVAIFTYVTAFSQKQLSTGRVDDRFVRFDNSLTTDEDMLRISNKKKELADSLLAVMKSSAVDCKLNEAEHGTLSCYTVPTPSMAASFHPIVEIDLEDKASVVQASAASRTPVVQATSRTPAPAASRTPLPSSSSSSSYGSDSKGSDSKGSDSKSSDYGSDSKSSGFLQSSAYPSSAYPSSAYPSSAYPSSAYPSSSFSSMHPSSSSSSSSALEEQEDFPAYDPAAFGANVRRGAGPRPSSSSSSSFSSSSSSSSEYDEQ
jgi:hypothetical protein